MRPTLKRLVLLTGLLALSVTLYIAATGTLTGALSLFSRQIQSAATFFVTSITAADIRADYEKGTVRILIVPGHQPGTGGTAFSDYYERDLVVEIADQLAKHLRQNSRYEVMVSRTAEAWHPTLLAYFAARGEDINVFRKQQALLMAEHIASGRFALEEEQVYHNTAPTAAALQLYGINLWTSEQSYDITLHLHLNDYAGRRWNKAGRHSGYAIYVPDRQYSNAAASRAIGEAIEKRLARSHERSTLRQERFGVVEDRELIATGANNTSDGAALLLEYGYIYEPQFANEAVRSATLADYAYQTYLGLQDFLGDPVAPTYGSLAP